MKSKIIAAFSDHIDDLTYLQEEHKALHESFESDQRSRKVRFLDQKDFKPKWIFEALDKHAKELRLFYFSGHSNKDVLKFYDGEGRNEALSAKLNSIARNHKLQCVVLNGCSNYKILENLVDVPIVIGTETLVEDQSASIFGKSFFTNLIDNNTSYQGAFDSAVASALNDANVELKGSAVTRGIQLENDYEDRNKWICIEKKEGLASQMHFQYARIIPNWAYVLSGMILIAIIGILSWSSIMFKIKGFKSPEFRKDAKCKILIEDFHGENAQYVNDYIEMGISSNDLFLKKIHVLSVPSFDEYIDISRHSADTLPYLAGYDHNITGTMDSIQDSIGLNFRIFPNPLNKILNEITVKSLRNMTSLLSNLDASNVDLQFLFQICSTCAYDNPELIPDIAIIADSIYHYNQEDGQKAYIQLGTIGRKNELSDVSYRLLDKASGSNAPDNDLALGALRISENYRMEDELFDAAYSDQSEIIERIGRRLREPKNIELNEKLEEYQRTYDEIRLKRATNVLNNVQQMGRSKWSKSEQLNKAIDDYKYLNSVKSDNLNYNAQIKQLQGIVKKDDSAIKFDIRKGRVKDQDGNALRDVRVDVSKLSKSVNTNRFGTFTIKFKSNTEFPLNIRASKKGYESNTRVVDENDKSIDIVLIKKSEKIIVKGKVIDKNKEPIFRANVSLTELGLKTLTDEDGSFSFELKDKSYLPVQVWANKKGYSGQGFIYTENKLSIVLVLDQPNIQYSISGFITDCEGIPISDISSMYLINANNMRVPVVNGRYRFNSSNQVGGNIKIGVEKPYLIIQEEDKIISLGQKQKIVKNIVVSKEMRTNKKLFVHGRVMITSPKYIHQEGVKVDMNNANLSIETNEEGLFEIVILNYDPCNAILNFSYPEYSKKSIDLRLRKDKDGIIDLGKIDLDQK